MEGNKKLPYSYHTFIYPFSFKEIGKLNIDTSNPDCEWEKEPFFNKDTSEKLGKASSEEKEEYKLQYNAYQYFFPKARKNMFNEENSDDISTLYRYKLDKENSFYIIKKTFYKTVNGIQNEEMKVEAELKLKALRVNIFSKLKVGVLSFEMEYHPTEADKEKAFEKALFINDFGRRLFPPYLVNKNEKLSTADIIEVKLETNRYEKREGTIITINYRDKNGKFNDVPELIEKILVKGNEKKSREEEIISPILDDRMFVVSLIRDDELSNSYNLKKAGIGTKNLKIENKKYYKLAERIYMFLFVDSESCSCQNREMLKEKLENHLYTRWVECGTIHGVTEYSMICITSTDEKIINSVINPFIMHYTEMVKLGLIQRASLVKLETEIGEICTDIENNKDTKRIENVWKNYILFQNQILLPEVTFQDQGVEIYQIIKKTLKIEDMNKYIDDELNNLHDLASMESNEIERQASEKLNISLNLLTVLGTILALINLGQDYIGGDIGKTFKRVPVFENIKNFIRPYIFDGFWFRYFIGFLSILCLVIWGNILFKRIGNSYKGWKRVGLIVEIIAFWFLVLCIPYIMVI